MVGIDFILDDDGNLVFKIKCRNLGILFWRSTGTSYGNYEVLVDGISVATLQGEFPGGWGNYAQSQEVFTSDEEAEHTVIIKKAEKLLNQKQVPIIVYCLSGTRSQKAIKTLKKLGYINLYQLDGGIDAYPNENDLYIIN